MVINEGAVLASIAINSPLMRFAGVSNIPMAIIEENVNLLERFINSVSFGRRKVIHASTSEKKIAKEINGSVSTPLFFFYKDTYMSRNTVDFIISNLSSGCRDGKEVDSIIFVVFHKTIPEEYLNHFFCIKLDEDCINYNSYRELIPSGEKVDELIHNMTDAIGTYEDSKAFLYSAKFLIEDQLKNSDSEAFEAAIIHLLDFNECMMDIDGINDIFILEFYRWIENNEVTVIELPIIPLDVSKKWNKIIFVSSGFMYLSSKCFYDIIADIRETVPIDVIKKALSDNGCLSKSHDNKYSFKMTYKIDGQYMRKRMMRFNMESIKIVGKPNWFELAGGILRYER